MNQINFQHETERLFLRVINSMAAPEVLRFYNDNREVFERYEAQRVANFYTLEYMQRVLDFEYNLCVKMSSIRFWVFPKMEPTHIIGTVCLRNITHYPYHSCEIGYKFDEGFWHQGYATEAIQKTILIAFHDMEIHRITAHIMPENIASLRLVERLGFEREGIARQSALIRGTWEDHVVYSILA